MNELKASPMLYLSGGSKELFHSNFLYWLGVNYRGAFQELMTKMCHINASWPEGWMIRREHKHLDLCVTYKECAFIIIENKVKSLPDLMQLHRYEQVYANHNRGCTYVVLSLVKDFPGQKYLNDNTCWQLHHYDELAQMIRDCFPDSVICQEHKPYIRDYCQYISSLSALAEGWKVDEHGAFLSQCDNLHELRLNDIYEKVRYAQIATLLAERLKTCIVNDSDEESVILGMSNTDVILRRGREDADEILSFYGCPEAKSFQQVFISSGMSHGVGLVEAKVKIADDCCLVIQVQGNHYCHAVESIDIANKELSEPQMLFLDFKQGGLINHNSNADSKICHYKSGFIYKWQKILAIHTISDIVDAMSTEIIEILNKKGYE